MSVTIYHNPRCSKSRATLDLVRGEALEPTIVEYLKYPPTAEELRRILKALNLSPRDLMRKKEPAYKENGLDDPSLNNDELIDAMIANPILIERPIVVNGDKVAIGRPPENVLAIL